MVLRTSPFFQEVTCRQSSYPWSIPTCRVLNNLCTSAWSLSPFWETEWTASIKTSFGGSTITTLRSGKLEFLHPCICLFLGGCVINGVDFDRNGIKRPGFSKIYYALREYNKICIVNGDVYLSSRAVVKFWAASFRFSVLSRNPKT